MQLVTLYGPGTGGNSLRASSRGDRWLSVQSLPLIGLIPPQLQHRTKDSFPDRIALFITFAAKLVTELRRDHCRIVSSTALYENCGSPPDVEIGHEWPTLCTLIAVH